MTTATDHKPVRRIVHGVGRYANEEYVVEVRAQVLVIRPKGTRRDGPAEVTVPFGSLYLNAMARRAR